MDEAMLWDAERRKKAGKRARELPKKLQRLPLVQQMFSTTKMKIVVRYAGGENSGRRILKKCSHTSSAQE